MVHFIKPSEVIERIRTTIVAATADLEIPVGFDTYDQRVGGSAYLSSITDADIQNFPTPSIFVSLTDNGVFNRQKERVDQDIFHGFDIVLVLDTVDSRKQTAEEGAITFKELLIYCLNGWKPIGYPSGTPLRLVGDSTVFSDKSKYVRVFTFEQDVHFNACEDGMCCAADFDVQNFENFFADLYATELGLEGLDTKLQVTDLYEEP